MTNNGVHCHSTMSNLGDSSAMDVSTAEKDQSGTNTHTGEEKVGENPLNNGTKTNENTENTAYNENIEMKLIEPSGNTKTDRSVRDTLSISERPRRNPRPSENQLKTLSKSNGLNSKRHG